MTFSDPIVTLADAERFLYGRLNFERTPGNADHPFRLDRMRHLVAAAGYSHWLYEEDVANCSPSQRAERSFPQPAGDVAERPTIIHIAGTKGKGSTTTILQSILTTAGHRVGTYTSPHLESIHGRFRINGIATNDKSLVESISHLSGAVSTIESGDQITFFELTTTAAIDLFAKAGCDVVILEVGLGGRLDSTNVFDSDIAAITTIGLDHQHILGHDHAAIATEKAGIIKLGRPVFSSVRHPDAIEAIEAAAEKQGAPLRRIDRDWKLDCRVDDDWGSRIEFRRVNHRNPSSQAEKTDNPNDIVQGRLAIEGLHQCLNASLAIAIAEHAFSIDQQAYRRGLARPGPPARLERFEGPGRRVVLLDSAHNADSTQALCQVLRQRLGSASMSLVFGTSVDKDAQAMLRPLTALADRIYLTRYADNPRSAPPQSLLPLVESKSSVTIIENAESALIQAVNEIDDGGWVVICGSFFLAAELRPRCLSADWVG